MKCIRSLLYGTVALLATNASARKELTLMPLPAEIRQQSNTMLETFLRSRSVSVTDLRNLLEFLNYYPSWYQATTPAPMSIVDKVSIPAHAYVSSLANYVERTPELLEKTTVSGAGKRRLTSLGNVFWQTVIRDLEKAILQKEKSLRPEVPTSNIVGTNIFERNDRQQVGRSLAQIMADNKGPSIYDQQYEKAFNIYFASADATLKDQQNLAIFFTYLKSLFQPVTPAPAAVRDVLSPAARQLISEITRITESNPAFRQALKEQVAGRSRLNEAGNAKLKELSETFNQKMALRTKNATRPLFGAGGAGLNQG